MELNTPIRVIVFLFLLIGNFYFYFKKEKYSNFEKFMFLLSLTVIGYNGAKFLFQF